jgi:hypothetical protein
MNNRSPCSIVVFGFHLHVCVQLSVFICIKLTLPRYLIEVCDERAFFKKLEHTRVEGLDLGSTLSTYTCSLHW